MNTRTSVLKAVVRLAALGFLPMRLNQFAPLGLQNRVYQCCVGQFSKPLLILFLIIGESIFSAGLARAQQGPALVAEDDRVVSVSRGSSAKAFRITSTILKETRQINI